MKLVCLSASLTHTFSQKKKKSLTHTKEHTIVILSIVDVIRLRQVMSLNHIVGALGYISLHDHV